ncbi:hypothetical protein LJC46_09520 [Desulfovibrio sp. OttesenSCG-928-G15]|nr:hypothetical protein [Desulfovibrio sp. OttesenSCG-928-G15]
MLTVELYALIGKMNAHRAALRAWKAGHENAPYAALTKPPSQAAPAQTKGESHVTP